MKNDDNVGPQMNWDRRPLGPFLASVLCFLSVVCCVRVAIATDWINFHFIMFTDSKSHVEVELFGCCFSRCSFYLLVNVLFFWHTIQNLLGPYQRRNWLLWDLYFLCLSGYLWSSVMKISWKYVYVWKRCSESKIETRLNASINQKMAHWNINVSWFRCFLFNRKTEPFLGWVQSKLSWRIWLLVLCSVLRVVCTLYALTFSILIMCCDCTTFCCRESAICAHIVLFRFELPYRVIRAVPFDPFASLS